MNQSPFEIAKGISNQFGGAMKENREASAIDNVLKQAMNTKNPQELNQIMTSMLSGVSQESRQDVARQLGNRMTELRREEDLKNKKLETKEKREFEEDKIQKKRTFEEGKIQEKRDFDELQELKKTEDSKLAYAQSGYPEYLTSLPPSVQAAEIKNLNNQKSTTDQLEIASNSIDRLEQLTSKVGLSKTATKAFFPKTDKAFSEFQTLIGGLEGALREMVNTGRITNSQFIYITEQLLPKPGDRQAQIKGKLKGVRQLLRLDNNDKKEKSPKVKSEDNISIQGIKGL